MVKLTPPPGINLILGGSAGGIFNRNYGSASRIVEDDQLNCGPTPRCADWQSWRETRLAYWKAVWPQPLDEWNPNPFNLADQLDRLRDAEIINVWAATGVCEQLFIASLVHLVSEQALDPGRIRLIQFERLASSGKIVLKTGHLNEENMAAHPVPAQLAADTFTHYLAAWRALTSPDPHDIATFGETHADANEWLRTAMQCMTRRIPEKASGLPYWDCVLLQKIAERGPRVSRAVDALSMDAWDQGDMVDDWCLHERLRRMARFPTPLLRLSGDLSDMFNGMTELTEFGWQVANGEASNYPTNPVDDWAAGVRLSSAEGTLWFNDGGRLVRG